MGLVGLGLGVGLLDNWRGVREVYRNCLLNNCGSHHRGFESLSLRSGLLV